MKTKDILKRIFALAVVCSMAAGAFSASADEDFAGEEPADTAQEYVGEQTADDGAQEDYTGEYDGDDTDYADGQDYTADGDSQSDYDYGYDVDDDYDYDYDADTDTDTDTDGTTTDDTAQDDTAEETQYVPEDDSSESEEQSDDETAEQTAQAASSVYSQRLAEIAEEQERIEKELADADDEMTDETQKQQLILEQINNLNSKIEVTNSYMTQLEMEISTARDKTDALKTDVDDGIEAYKKRLRAMYIAGSTSYTEVLLGSGDFFDVLLRSELLKRVTEYDANALDELVEKKEEYESKVADLESKQAEYDAQSTDLEAEKEKLTELYESSSQTKALLKQQKEALEKEQETYDSEISAYEGTLGTLLKGTYSSSADEEQRLETETLAGQKINELKKSLGDDLSDDECGYDFKWPVPGNYYVSSGVGARWGTYHKGLDITGDSGTAICAAEAGTVVTVNNSCTHNYGKSSSCGCGGGYGNFVIIDHGNGFLTLYGHMTKALVSVGDTVKQGEQIGTMGTTGYSTGTHLHFELRYNGYITNPAAFLKL